MIKGKDYYENLLTKHTHLIENLYEEKEKKSFNKKDSKTKKNQIISYNSPSVFRIENQTPTNLSDDKIAEIGVGSLEAEKILKKIKKNRLGKSFSRIKKWKKKELQENKLKHLLIKSSWQTGAISIGLERLRKLLRKVYGKALFSVYNQKFSHKTL